MLARFPFLSLGFKLLFWRAWRRRSGACNRAHPARHRSQFATVLEAAGFPYGVAIVWLITASEILCGLLLISGRYVRFAVLPLLAIAGGGIAIIHARLGWFVGEFGTGGSEYSVALIVLLLVIAAADRQSTSISK